MMSTRANRYSREREFHDAWADATAVADVDVVASFEHPTALENRFVLQQLGDLRGLRVLDLGAGLGEASVYFARAGAHVTAADVSPGMLDLAGKLAAAYAVSIDRLLIPVGQTDLGDERFDIVYGANVLHHVSDVGSVLDGVRRALVTGGRCFFIDPLKYNPVIWIYRFLARDVRSDDEYPVGFDVLDTMKRRFAGVEHREFWGLSLSLFVKYYAVDRLDPNRVRYWKRILKEDPAALAKWWIPLSQADDWLLRVPGLRRLAWNTVYWGHKAR